MNEKSKNKKRLVIFFALPFVLIAIFLIILLALKPESEFTNAKYTTEGTYLSRAKSLLENNPLIDGHNDMAYLIRANFRNDLEKFNLKDLKKYVLEETDNVTHTDLNRLKVGRLGGQFWSVYANCDSTGKDATRIHLEQIDLIKRIIAKYSDDLQFVTSTKEMEQAFANKKLGSLLGMESAHAIDSSMGLLRIFYSLGVRYMTLTHNCDVPWATNNLVDLKPNAASLGGLNDFGKLVIKEMNRLGMIVDISHVSTKTMEDALEVSRAPVMFSHSSVYKLCNHTRNVKDHVLKKLKENNGIIMINFYNEFLTCSLNASVENAVKHIQYVKDLIGVDHIGIGADYDGVPITPTKLEDVSKYPNIFAALLENGWTEEELIKIAGSNIMRVLKDVENYARSVVNEVPSSVEIDKKLLENNPYAEQYRNCRTDI